MNKLVRPLTQKEITQTHTRASQVEGWYLRVEETSNLVFKVDGMDLYGRIVSKTGVDPDQLIIEVETEIEGITP